MMKQLINSHRHPETPETSEVHQTPSAGENTLFGSISLNIMTLCLCPVIGIIIGCHLIPRGREGGFAVVNIPAPVAFTER